MMPVTTISSDRLPPIGLQREPARQRASEPTVSTSHDRPGRDDRPGDADRAEMEQDRAGERRGCVISRRLRARGAATTARATRKPTKAASSGSAPSRAASDQHDGRASEPAER